MWGKPTLFHWEKSIEKNTEIYMYIYIYIYIYIDKINWEKFFDRSAETYWVFIVNFEQVIT